MKSAVKVLVLVFLGGCGSGEDSSKDGSVCTAGSTEACECDTGGTGERTCNSDGSEWGACENCVTPVSPAQACDAHIGAVCNLLQRCAGFSAQINYGDVATCRARNRIGCEETFSAKGVTFLAEQMSTCAASFAGLSCQDLFSDNLPAACDFPAGTLPNGSVCGDEQCQSGACRMTSACGTCAATVPAGSSCANGERCADGLKCASNGMCVSPGAAGAPCGVSLPCKSPLACRNGTCSAASAAGGACNQSSDCDPTAGLLCNGGTCQAVSFADAGQPCGFIAGGVTLCRASGFCRMVQGQASGTCVAAAADGATCNDLSGPSCMPPAACINGTCQLQGVSCN